MKKPKPDGSELEHWVRPLKVGGRWGRVTSDDKEMVDVSAIRDDFAPSFKAEFGLILEDIRPGTDPPDIVARIGQQVVSIEISELLRESVREKKAKGIPVSFEEQQWTGSQLIDELNSRLDKKQAKYSGRPDRFVADALLIVCSELWLPRHSLKTWLSGTTFKPRGTIRAAYFGVEGLAGDAHFPLFSLYGALTGS